MLCLGCEYLQWPIQFFEYIQSPKKSFFYKLSILSHAENLLLMYFDFDLIFVGSFMVLFCRIYNGVHSPADVVTGSLLGVMIVLFMNRFDNAIDMSSVTNGSGKLFVVVCTVVNNFLFTFTFY